MAESIVPQGSEAANSSSYKHGHSPWGVAPSPTYNTWRGMLDRCRSSTHVSYHNYGGRGIKVCDRWLGDQGFQNFLEDMGPRPSSAHSLDRIDNDGHYCPENCRWADRETQGNNQRTNRLITAFGRTQTLAQWSKEVRISHATLRTRIVKCGWESERALTTPVRARRNNG